MASDWVRPCQTLTTHPVVSVEFTGCGSVNADHPWLFPEHPSSLIFPTDPSGKEGEEPDGSYLIKRNRSEKLVRKVNFFETATLLI
jgi:hypothetical protein